MIGAHIGELTLAGMGYVSWEEAGVITAHYSEQYRHLMLARHGIVFLKMGNVDSDDAVDIARKKGREIESLNRTKTSPVNGLRDTLIQQHAGDLYVALRRVYNGSHDQFGTMIGSIRPKRTEQAVAWATTTFKAVREDIRTGTRVLGPVERQHV